ncbi:zinc finger protein [Macleaya cordata]|uniref:Zinc finger protein n=1 Tax=Macleaya cordata TaxID=56857 RepID=A0A200R9H9_MACCD|nr:zinc finger protein [Macleaya cordata]
MKSPPAKRARGKSYAQQKRPYPCRHCGKVFWSSYAMGGHQTAHRKSRSMANGQFKTNHKQLSFGGNNTDHVLTVNISLAIRSLDGHLGIAVCKWFSTFCPHNSYDECVHHAGQCLLLAKLLAGGQQ